MLTLCKRGKPASFLHGPSSPSRQNLEFPGFPTQGGGVRWGKPGTHGTVPTSLARGAVRVCCHSHYREHRAGHHAPAVHVCVHWSAALQGEATPGQQPFPPHQSQLEGL